MEQSKYPSFFCDNSTSDKLEEVLDFILSWTLRCANSKYAEVDNLLHSYAKRVLAYCLFQDADALENSVVSEVKVWRQCMQIDLWVELVIDNEHYALIIENKMYAPIRDGQLDKYKNIAINHYNNHPKYKHIVYILYRGDVVLPRDEEICAEKGYKLISSDDLKEAMKAEKLTGNFMFDEFWFYWWNPNKE